MDPTIDPKAYFAVVDERDEARRKLEEVFDSWQQAERRIGEVEKERDSLAARVAAGIAACVKVSRIDFRDYKLMPEQYAEGAHEAARAIRAALEGTK